MPSLAESVGNWLGRVEILARGAEDERRAAVKALDRGNALEARAHARELLDKAPGSPLALALLAEACEKARFYDEAAAALRTLCAAAPWRGELWLSLADMLDHAGAPSDEVGRACQSALGPDCPASVRSAALLKLADLDLAAGDPWRAARWLDALPLVAGRSESALRRLEVAVAVGDRASASRSLDDLGEPPAIDPRATLACARARWMRGDPAVIDLLLRAFILDAAGADLTLASYLATSRDVVEVKRVRDLLSAVGRDQEPGFALALAHAEGRTEDARRVLQSIAKAGDLAAARSLYGIALERMDPDALLVAVDALGEAAPSEGRSIARALRAPPAAGELQTVALLDELASSHAQIAAFADRLRTDAYALWIDGPSNESLQPMLTELRRLAGSLDRLDLAASCEALAIEMQRPLRVAVVGEFNAGKSTFINALIGADVAPTGILPTTASLHWLSWAPDSFARVETRDGPDRVVPHEALKTALRELQEAGQRVRKVHICAPIERLRRIEVIDTPGFNAPDTDHIEAAERAFSEAHVALWLMDATQALKATERSVLGKIAALGTPVQVLLNKCDRLANDALAQITAAVRSGLDDAGLRTLAPVVAFSARLALAGRLGDEQARSRSRWDDVEQVLQAVVVNPSDGLRRTAVRRKALRIAVALEEELAGRQRAHLVPANEAVARRDGAWLLASLDRTALERALKKLEVACALLEEDLKPLRVAGVAMADGAAQAFAEERLVARLVDPMTDALAAEARWDATLAASARGPVAAVLRGAASTLRSTQELPRVVGTSLVRACAIAVQERSAELAMAQAAPGVEAVPRVRVGSLRAALQRGLLAGL